MGRNRSSGCLIIPIILVMLAIAWVASSTLGNPSDPAGEVKPFEFNIPLPEAWSSFPGQFDDGQAEGWAQSARATADAIKDNKVRATEQARISTEEASVYQTQEANRAAFEATERAQATTSAYFLQIAIWTKEADSVKSTSEAQVTATQAVVQATEQTRLNDLEFARQAARATATASFLQDEQTKRELDLRQKAITNDVWAVTKWVIPVAVLLMAGFIGYRFTKRIPDYTVIQPAANGSSPKVIRNGSILNPDLLTAPVTNLALPAQIPLENQLAVKAADQQINMARAMPRLIPQSVSTAPGFQVIDDMTALPGHLLPDSGGVGAIDIDWNEDKPMDL